MGQPMTRGKGNVFRRRKEKEKEKGRRETYLKCELIKQYKMSGRRIPLMLRLQNKREDKKKEMSQQVYRVSRGKTLYEK